MAKKRLNRWMNGSGLLTKTLLAQETSINYVWLRMAKMEMDCDLKKLAIFFFLNTVMCILEPYKN